MGAVCVYISSRYNWLPIGILILLYCDGFVCVHVFFQLVSHAISTFALTLNLKYIRILYPLDGNYINHVFRSSNFSSSSTSTIAFGN